MVTLSSFISVNYEKTSSSYCAMLYCPSFSPVPPTQQRAAAQTRKIDASLAPDPPNRLTWPCSWAPPPSTCSSQDRSVPQCVGSYRPTPPQHTPCRSKLRSPPRSGTGSCAASPAICRVWGRNTRQCWEALSHRILLQKSIHMNFAHTVRAPVVRRLTRNRLCRLTRIGTGTRTGCAGQQGPGPESVALNTYLRSFRWSASVAMAM